MINLAVESYKEKSEMNLDQYGFEMVYFFDDEKTDTQAFIANDFDSIVIAFRGTSSFQDILTDLSFGKANFPPTRRFFFKPKVHKGFHRAFESIGWDVRTAVKQLLKENDYHIYVTGHSLGGALACLMALDLYKHVKKDFTVYTFGAPRVGNSWFMRHYNRRIKSSFRIVNDDDVVPQLPSPTAGYRQVDTYVLIDEEERILLDPPMGKQLEKDVEGWSSTLRSGISEHRSEYYQSLLENVSEVFD